MSLLFRPWMVENWRAVCAWAAAFYMLLVFGGQAYMASRPKFVLRPYLTAWNIFLASECPSKAKINIHYS
jgi:hypothetical protein